MKSYSIKILNDNRVIVDSDVNKLHLQSLYNLMSILKGTKSLEKIEMKIKNRYEY
jgi:hypothetical protein